MSSQIVIDSIKENVDRNGGPVLIFNVLWWLDERSILLPGFRLAGGCIQTPSSKRNYTWYPTIYISKALARDIYQEVITTLQAKGLAEKYKLNCEETVLAGLVDVRAVGRYFPSLVGQI